MKFSRRKKQELFPPFWWFSIKGKKMPAETQSLVTQAQARSTRPLQPGKLLLPLVERRKSKKFKAYSLEYLKRKHFIQKYVLLFVFLYPAKSRIPRARSREWSAVSEKPAKICENSANEMLQEPTTTCTTCMSGGVNMDRFFLFLVLHDGDPSTQDGKIISTNTLVI